jgi:flavin reductase (DIM6/NTAB) family NADH-FMN oxidoreductase RutF
MRMNFEARTFRRIMRSLAAGVTVVTARDRQGRPWGLTATAVCIVSWDPPMVLVCIDRAAECHGPFAEAGGFAINVLREDQEDLSRHFANRDADKFAGVSWRDGETGAPILEGALAHVECQTASCLPAGDHTIFLGKAVGGGARADADAWAPLLYFRGTYARLTRRGPA